MTTTIQDAARQAGKLDPRRITAAAIADQALIKAFTQWKPSKGAQRFVDEAFVRAFGAWRATR